VKIATWNVNSLRVRLDHVRSWLATAEPDVLALQETKVKDEDFPVTELESLGYHCAFSGQPGYNGVALITRAPLSDVATDLKGLDGTQRRVLSARLGALRIVNLYVPNGERVDSDKYEFKLDWLAAMREYLSEMLSREEHVLVLGDFNIAPSDEDVRDPRAWEGKVLCSTAERAGLEAILALGFIDTFRLFDQPARSYSWWDYRAGGFRRNMGLRIDLILASTAFSKMCRRCSIDSAPRGWERPSDHAPVVAEFECS
jgi:exodeoxyribonuclease III